jgi:hypothetical protein
LSLERLSPVACLEGDAMEVLSAFQLGFAQGPEHFEPALSLRPAVERAHPPSQSGFPLAAAALRSLRRLVQAVLGRAAATGEKVRGNGAAPLQRKRPASQGFPAQCETLGPPMQINRVLPLQRSDDQQAIGTLELPILASELSAVQGAEARWEGGTLELPMQANHPLQDPRPARKGKDVRCGVR